MLIPRTVWSISFLVIVFVQAAIVLAFEGYVFGKFEANISADINTDQAETTVAIPTYLALFIFSQVYQLVLTVDALRLKNTIQVTGLCLFNAAMLVYAGIQYEQIKQASHELSNLRLVTGEGYVLDGSAWGDIEGFLIAIISIIGVGSFVMGYICFQLYKEFGWSIYKQIGADLRMKRRYLAYQIFMTMLKFDFFFFLGFTIQFCVIVLARKDVEFGLTIAVIPCTILVLAVTAMCVRHESTVGMIGMITVFFAGMAYFLFKLVRMYQSTQAFKYVAARKSLTVFAVITLVLIVVTISNAIVCTINFNKGLRQYILGSRRSWFAEKTESEEEAHEMTGLGRRRMTLE
ncbi:hypothetical protein V1512DRAFT_169266 [Lipomyces arxii]|uniref:uncharacterized protein n=1 Tax=Lipomyces arxii TaxID=56418 RepID=UPI0034CE8324